jgi:transposase
MRRLRPLALQQKGWSQRGIAIALGVTEGAVSKRLKRARRYGSEALRHCRSPSRLGRLRDAPRRPLRLLERGAEALGYTRAVWTTTSVAPVIGCKFGGACRSARSSRSLRRLGWRVRYPLQRASPRDEAATAAWQTERRQAPKRRLLPEVALSCG